MSRKSGYRFSEKDVRKRRTAGYSPWMLASLITLPHFSDSAFMKAAVSAGVLPTGRAP